MRLLCRLLVLATCLLCIFGGGQPRTMAGEPLLEKIDLFEAGKDDYALYRIPGLIVTAKGTVLAYCEARRTGKSDWDTIDIILRRSTDGGKTWSPRKKIADVPGEKTKNPVALAQKLANPDDVTYNNAVAFADRDGTVHMLFCLEYCRCFYLRSDDDGQTFTPPAEITSTFDKFRTDYDWKVLATGPAHGIQLRSGRLVVPVWLSTGTGGHAHRPSVTATVYSDDRGKTWQRGEIAVPNTDEWIFPSETVIVELADGQVMLNVRSESKANRRLVTMSGDGATGWSKPKFDDALAEPICMASIVRVSKRPERDKNRIAFANPDNLARADGKEAEGKPRDRKNLSIKLTYDEGKTWPVNKVLEPGYSAYSDLAVLGDGTILCLYERGRDADAERKKPTSYAYLTLARFNVEWLTDGKDVPAKLVGSRDKESTAVDRGEGNGISQGAYGLQTRVPWTTSNFRGRPEPPPPFRAERFLPKLSFKQPTVLTSAPGTSRMFVAEHAGKIYSMPDDPSCSQADLMLDVKELVDRLNEETEKPLALEAVYGLTFDPQFADNRYCYVCYVVRHRDRSLGQLPDGTRVSRLSVSNTDPPRCDVESERLMISWLQGGHNGGCLKFGPDGCLYISAGDGGFAFPPDGLNSGQDMTNLMSTIMRIDVHHEQDGRPYTIPVDNPFVSLPKARGEIWAYGLRNPWKMSFDRATGDLWVGDVGWELWELVFRVNRGDNFGWSIVEGRQPVHTERQRGPTPIVPPTIEIPHTEGASVTGGFVYRGKKFSELYGSYIFGDWETRRIWGATVNGKEIGPKREIVEPTVRIVDFSEGPDGELYLLDHDDGTIHSLVRNEVKPSQQQFPRKLTETGIFRSVPSHDVADGVLPFSINTEQWSDHATAERFLAVPGNDPIRLHAKAKIVPGSMFSRTMDFPRDSVVIKTLSLDLVQGDPSSRRRVETQVLHYDGRDWHGYTYEWNDEQTDAHLVDGTGKSRAFRVTDPQAPGGYRAQNWWFASRMECVRCHNPWSEHTLAFNIPQINRSHDYGSVSDNQIRTLRHIGLFEDAIDPIDPEDPLAKIEPPKPPEELPHLSNPYDAALEVNDRARSYLHVNCGHCHRFNGGGSSYIYLQHHLPLRDVKALGVRPTQGTFGIHEAQIIAPGDPYRSVLYFRLAKAGPGHMPHLGSKIVDPRGLALVHDWIRQLPMHLEDSAKLDQLAQLDEAAVLAREHEESPRTRWQLARAIAQKSKRHKPNEDDQKAAEAQAVKQAAERVKQRAEERRKLTEELLANPSRAMLAALAIRDQRLSDSIRELVVETAIRGTEPAIRDLFEPFIPDERKVQRLGDAIQPDTILKLAGDLERGRRLFHESTVVQCRNCHRIGDQGIELGPDLNAVGKKYDRVKLLENMLQPSLNVEPKYMTWLVETKSGTVHSGLLVKRDDAEVLLKDAQNKSQRIPAGEIEGMFPQNKSIMPEAMFRDFTAQQVADLLSYLSSLK